MPEDGANGVGDLRKEGPQPPPTPPPMPKVGETFAGRYAIERTLGRGGMGVVYLARQAPLDRLVALKVLKPPEHVEDDPHFDARFLREAAAAARLQHPNTITVYDFGRTDDNHLYIVMEYLEGVDVRTALAHEGVFGAQRAIHVAKQVCKSLREAHAKGMVHRDLKPANVLLIDRDEDIDFVKVLDFGLVKFRGEASEITLAGKFLGSPRYTSPESLDRNAVVDHRADIYAVGILLYTMLTGTPPFDGDPMQVLNAHLHEIPKPMYKVNPAAQSTPELEALVQQCLEKEPRKRFDSMPDLITALREVGSYFGDEQTETLDLELSETSDLFDGPLLASRSVEPEPEPPPSSTPGARASTSTVTRQMSTSRRRKRRRGPTPLVLILVTVLVVAVAAIAVLMLKLADDVIEVPSAGVVDLSQPELRPVQLTVQAVEATISWKSGDAWEPLGAAPLQQTLELPVELQVVVIRLEQAGVEPRNEVLRIIDGVATFVQEAPEVTAAPTPRPTPRPTAASTRPPTTPAPTITPTPTPRPTVEPTPEPTPPAGDDDTLPTGYKDNPY